VDIVTSPVKNHLFDKQNHDFMPTDNRDLSINPEKLRKTTLKIWNDIVLRDKDLLNKYQPEHYMNLLDTRPETASYTYIPPELRRFFHNIIGQSDRRVLHLYHKLIIVSLIDKNRTTLHHINMPGSIKKLYEKSFGRIVREIEINPDEFYEFPKDKFVKDLNLCALKLIPVGPCVIEMSELPKYFLLKKGLSQFIKGLIFVSFQTGGFKPFYQIHTYRSGLAEFNEPEWDRAYLRIADLLKIETRVKGAFGSSWFVDPGLQFISPRLTYLRERFEHNGGKIFYIESTVEDVRNATLVSPTRRRLYEEGKYIPRKYMRIWPRKQLISWAERYRADIPAAMDGLPSHHKEAMMQSNKRKVSNSEPANCQSDPLS
jgi:hypothetical protein